MTNPENSLSRTPPRLGDGMEPAGHLCDACEKREASTAWGDPMTINHGGGEWRCEICMLTAQLEHALERAQVIPELQARLAAARAREANGV